MRITNLPQTQFGVKDRDILKEMKKEKKAQKKAHQESHQGQRERVAKKARNRFFLKSYAKSTALIPAGIVASILTGNPLPWIAAVGAKSGRLIYDTGGYLGTADKRYPDHSKAKNIFSRAKIVRENAEADFDKYKQRAEENAKKLSTEETVEDEGNHNLGEGEY